MRDPQQFGIELADRLVSRLETHTAMAEMTLSLAGDLALRANAMLAKGVPRAEVAAWVREVEAAFSERLDEVLVETAENQKG
jgi:hypothetical protein